MTEFNFKIPQLPNHLKKRNDNSLQFERSNRNDGTVLMAANRPSNSLLMKRDKMKLHNPLKPINGTDYDNQMGASTSRDAFFQDDRVSSFRRFQESSDVKEHISEMESNLRCKHFVNHGCENKVGVSVNMDLQSSQLRSNLSKNNSNLNSYSNSNITHFKNIESRNSCLNSHERGKNVFSDYCRGMCNSVNTIGLSASQSSKKSLFGSDNLPKRNNYSRDLEMGHCSNNFKSGISSFNCLNGTNTLPKDLSVQFREGRNVIDSTSTLIWEVSLVSMKEQALNSLEKFGHTLLSNICACAHQHHQTSIFQFAFDKVLKEVKHIFESGKMALSSTRGAGEVQSLNYPSKSFCECGRAGTGATATLVTSGQYNSPRNILHKLVAGGEPQDSPAESPPVESFVVRKKMLKDMEEDSNGSDVFLPVKSKVSSKSKVLKLQNWCPIAAGKTLIFKGVIDGNVEFMTLPVKSRIDHRNLLLVNGQICKLIGNLTTENSLPEEIKSKLKNGLHPHWRMLTDEIAKYQKEREEDGAEDATDGETDQGKTNNKGNKVQARKGRNLDMKSPVSAPKTSERKTISDGSKNRRKSKERKSAERKAKSPVTPRRVERRNESEGPKQKTETRNQDRGRSRQRNNDSAAKNESRALWAETPRSAKVESSRNNDSVHITKSGRVVKAPGSFWLGTVSGSEGKNEKGKELKRKREIVDPDETQKIKRSKSGELNEEEVAKPAKKSPSAKSKKKKEEKEEKIKVKGKAAKAEQSKSPSKSNKKKGKSPTASAKAKPTGEATNQPKNDIFETLDDILIPECTNKKGKTKSKRPDFRLDLSRTPPQKYMNQLRVLRSCTPNESPNWQATQHSQSAVKCFEKIRARKFKHKIKPDKVKKKEPARKVKEPVRNKDVDAIVNWIGERHVKSPKATNSKVLKYVIPKCNTLEDEDREEEDEENYNCI